MGYLRRKLDRARARDEKRGSEARADREGMPSWLSGLEETRSAFVRFSTPEIDEGSGQRLGVFHAASDLVDGGIHDEYAAEVEALFEWFNRELPVPKIRRPGAVFFFKTDSDAFVRRMWDFAWILREHGVTVELTAVERPGQIVYEDDYQVAAIPGLSRI